MLYLIGGYIAYSCLKAGRKNIEVIHCGLRLIEIGVYAFYSGGIYSYDFTDLLDYSLWETDYINATLEYFDAGLNGDGFVDLLNYSILETNDNDSITSSYPIF